MRLRVDEGVGLAHPLDSAGVGRHLGQPHGGLLDDLHGVPACEPTVCDAVHVLHLELDLGYLLV